MCCSTDTRATVRPTVFTKTVSPASLDQLATARGLPKFPIWVPGPPPKHVPVQPSSWLPANATVKFAPANCTSRARAAANAHRPGDWALSQAALARRAMIASLVSSLAAESETNAATARCRPSGRVIMPMSLVAEDDWLAPASPSSPHN